jgi:perosamine synthetase
MEKNIKERIESMTISSRGTIREAIAAIGKGKFGVALLIDPDTGIFEGLINDGDIRRAFLKGSGLNSPVDEVAHPKTVTMKAGAPSHEIIKKFSKRIRVIPILDEKGYVVDLYTFDRRVNIPVAEPKFQEIDLSYITECILTGWVSSSGKFVKRFEELFAKFCHAKFAVSTTSGTTALHLALVVLGVGPGDEVIVPTLTFIATANAVRYTGAQPVFVDSDSETWNINAAEIELAITSKTKAIIPVHLYGHPANMDPIIKIAAKHGLAVVEDITTGEGGMVVTNNGALAEKIRILRDHGMDENRRYWHTVLGYNYRMTNIQAALGVAQMERIGYILERKRKIALAYHKALKDLPGITLPPEAKWAKNVFWMYSILIDGKQFGMTRDELMERLESKGIETRPIFPPVHIQPIYATGQNLPIAERLAVQGLNLPSSINLTQRDIARIADLIAGFSQAS